MMKLLFAALVLGLGLTSCETTDSAPDLVTSQLDEGAAVASDDSSTVVSPGVKPYPRSNCLVTGEELDAKGTPMTFIHQDQEVKVCCAACKMAFNMSPRTYMERIQ